MDIGKLIEELGNKTVKFTFLPKDIDTILAASNLKSHSLALSYFGKERFEELLNRIETTFNNPPEEGEEISMFVLMVVLIMVTSVVNEDFKKQIIEQVGEETLEETFTLVKNSLESILK